MRIRFSIRRRAKRIERRSHARTPVDARIRWYGSEVSLLASQEVQVCDVSEGGIKLKMPVSMQIGAPVQIRLKNATAWAEVRFCRPLGPSEFEIGFQVRELRTRPPEEIRVPEKEDKVESESGEVAAFEWVGA